MPTPPLLTADALTLTLGQRTLCRGLSLSVHAGEWWVVLGPNGVGKSTLLATLAGLRGATAGTITLAGRPLTQWSVREQAQWRGWLAQNPFFPGDATVLEAVLVGRHPDVGRWGWETAADLAIAREALVAVDLAGFEARRLHTLSGGEKQRVAIATLLAQQPRVYLVDEPTNHLDLRHQRQVLEQLATRCRAGAAVIAALHDLNWAARYATHAVLLSPNGDTEVGEAATLLTAERLSALYGLSLTACGNPPQRHFIPSDAGS
jgi:iron complex transport system ATP-binding protein